MAKSVTTKHVMLSYQWKVQKLALSMYEYLVEKKIPVWIDIKCGHPSKNLYEGLSHAIENSSCFVCFMTPEYQESDFCQQEFLYAKKCHIPIIPLKLDENWEPTSWLGFQTVGLVWLDFYRTTKFKIKASELHGRICTTVGDLYQQSKSQESVPKAKKIDCQPRSLNNSKFAGDELAPYISHLKIKEAEGTPYSDKPSHPKQPCKFGLRCNDYSDSHRAWLSHPSSTEEIAQPTKQPRPCRYGANCFDISDSHQAQFLHPSSTEEIAQPTKQPRPCRYGANCSDISDSHRAQFLHPPSTENDGQPSGVRSSRRSKFQHSEAPE
ncbi:unnamed protein product [Rotaria magnacalcarata]|uniref:TIR domain-containing protein n=1 Tax=Rotaria magnacalcarata TaxID=392030 RepID=A0A814VA91_9BILA|nr:unnamed protein product [Rotaria magnacalcarata]CAF1579236.1 unnamed protein product [Rotaria magnacalcarata]